MYALKVTFWNRNSESKIGFIKNNKNISKLVLPSKYKCFHIRRGDKVGETLCRWADKCGQTESKRYDFEDYLKKSDQLITEVLNDEEDDDDEEDDEFPYWKYPDADTVINWHYKEDEH